MEKLDAFSLGYGRLIRKSRICIDIGASSLSLSLSALVDNARRKMKGVGVAAKAHQVPGLPLEEALTAFPVPIFGSGPHRGKLQKPILRK